MKNKALFPLSLLVFYAIQIFFLKSAMYQLGIFFYFLYAFLLYNVDKKLIISLFVLHLPLLPIIPTDYKLFGIVGPFEIIYGFSFFLLKFKYKKQKGKLNKYQKTSINFIYFLFFINVYILIKDIIVGVDKDSSHGAMLIFKRTFRYFLYYSSLVLLVKNIYIRGVFDYVFAGIKYSVVILVISMVFTEPLILMGADIANKEIYFSRPDLSTRYSGFYGAGGDQNSAGVFLAGVIGFFLALYEKNRVIKDYIVFMGFAVLGVLLTGSRTSFMAMSTVVLIFLITNKSGKDKFMIFISCVAFYFIFSDQLDMVIQRFFDPSAKSAVDPKSDGRVWKWIYYTEWMFKNPDTFLIGNLKNIPLKYAPHNYFIYLTYHAGLVTLFTFLILFFKLIRSIKFTKTKFTLKNAYYIIPFPFILMTVNSFGASIYLWLFLPIGAFFYNQKLIKKNTI